MAEFHALRQALERTEEDLALVLGVLAGMWPSSLVPVAGGAHMRVAIDTPAGTVAFTLSRGAAARIWHVPETADGEPDEDAARLRDQRLVQLATAFAPAAAGAAPSHLRVTDRHPCQEVRGDTEPNRRTP